MQTSVTDSPTDYVGLAEALGALADPVRLRLVALLMAFDEPLCVCELSSGLALPEYRTSRHLTALRRAGIVSCRRQGLWSYYNLAANACLDPLRGLIRVYPEDLARMQARLEQRVAGRCTIGPTSEGAQRV